MNLKIEKKKVLKIIPEVIQTVRKRGFELRINDDSFSLSGNNISILGDISFNKENIVAKKVKIKIVGSLNKFADIKREEFMYGFIKKLGYPCPNILLSGKLPGRSIMFQIREYSKGVQLREAKSEVLRAAYPRLISFFVDLHSNTLEGFGLINQFNGLWRGDSNDWIKSLEDRAKNSLIRIKNLGITLNPNVFDNLMLILSKNFNLLNTGYRSILHGDAGLINFLGDNTGLTAIVDPEFALVGDPAYEFCEKIGDDKDYPISFINQYFDKTKQKGVDIKRETFFKRGMLYSPFIVINIISSLAEAGNIKSANYFISILQTEIERALSI